MNWKVWLEGDPSTARELHGDLFAGEACGFFVRELDERIGLEFAKGASSLVVCIEHGGVPPAMRYRVECSMQPRYQSEYLEEEPWEPPPLKPASLPYRLRNLTK